MAAASPSVGEIGYGLAVTWSPSRHMRGGSTVLLDT
jgi:hypothetical protein